MKSHWKSHYVLVAVWLMAIGGSPAGADEPLEWCQTQAAWEASGLGQVSGSDCGLGSCDTPSVRDMWIPEPGEGTPLVTIRVRFHIFCDGSNCAATAEDVLHQMNRLNLDFADYRIQFIETTEFLNDSTYRNVGEPVQEDAMKNAHADVPAQQVNVYVVNFRARGVGTYPWEPDALGNTGGAIIDDDDFGLGRKTLTHELGHCLGLYHTHYGVSEVHQCSACYERADGVNGDTTGDLAGDTRPTPTNLNNCGPPGGTDSCSATAWGVTDTQNYMSYAPDSCYTEFSAHQSGRMHCWTHHALTGWMVCASNGECDDQNECTEDVCVQGICEHDADPDGTFCGGGGCCQGFCTTPTCETNADCDDGEECTTDACVNSGTCNAHCANTWPECGPTPQTRDYCCGPVCGWNNDFDCHCGIGGCNMNESQCNCPEDCGDQTADESPGSTCRDGLDNDCDGFADCDDVEDCASDSPVSPCYCTDHGGTRPLTCVDWSGTFRPEIDQDFSIEIPNPDEPGKLDVTFVTGNYSWRVWSQASWTNYAPANLGDVKINPNLLAEPPENFSVTVAHGTLDGAVNVGSMTLVKTDWTGQSNISGGSIAGDFGDLILQESQGDGGSASFTIGGNVFGDITIPRVDTFEVKGAVSTDSTITFREFVGDMRAEFNTLTGDFAGDLVLPGGLVAGAEATIHGMLTSNGTINFEEQILEGSLSLHGGSASGSSISVGALTGQITFADAVYSGTAALSIVDAGAVVRIEDATLVGYLIVDGNWWGALQFVGGVFAPTAIVSIGGFLGQEGSLDFETQPGGMSGQVHVGDNCSGAINVIGNMDGEILVGGLIASPGSVAITGVLNGKLCADNLAASQPLPLNIQIGCGIGWAGKICNQEPACPAGNIVLAAADPPNGTKDARQPHPVHTNALSARQGLASPNAGESEDDIITMTLAAPANSPIPSDQMRAISHDCWYICETGTEPVDPGIPALSMNKMACLSQPGQGTSNYQPTKYEIRLERPISAMNWTGIRYKPGTQKIIYASLPGNVNGDNWTDGVDLIQMADCFGPQHLNCPTTVYTQDMDRSGAFLPADHQTFLELWNGEQTFIPWSLRSLPPNACGGGGPPVGGPYCTSMPCEEDPGAMAMSAPGGGGLEESSFLEELEEPNANAEFADGFVRFLTDTDPAVGEQEDVFDMFVQSMTQWCIENFTVEERAALVARINDPLLAFASAAGAEAAVVVIDALE